MLILCKLLKLVQLLLTVSLGLKTSVHRSSECTYMGAFSLKHTDTIQSSSLCPFGCKKEAGCMNAAIERRVGQNIRALRERIGLTQAQLAARLQINGCDITRSAIAKIEVGQRHLYPDEILLLHELLAAPDEEIFAMD